MNTFKSIVMVCAMLTVSCSGQYMSQSSSTQGSQSGSAGLSGMLGSQSYASQQIVSNTGALPLEQPRPAASPAFEQSKPATVPGTSSTPATFTQQICSCITISPAASAHQEQAASSPVAGAVAPATAQQQNFAPSQEQTFAAPQQQTFAAPQQQNTFVATASAQQQQVYVAPQPASAQTQGRY